MSSVLLYIGIGLIVIGWLALACFAAKQLSARRQYERLPQKWEEVKHGLIRKRMISRGMVIAGLICIIISLLV